MTEAVVQIVNDLGLHARAAARFVHLANRFDSRISVSKGDARVNGKSILGLLTLAASRGVKIKLMADGKDEKEAIEQLIRLVRQRFGEDE